jgi:hypothetical protein
VATPTPVVYHECPYCKYLFRGHASQDRAKFIFDDHSFYSLPFTKTTRFVTCEKAYFDHVAQMIETMRKVGAGSIETVKP